MTNPHFSRLAVLFTLFLTLAGCQKKSDAPAGASSAGESPAAAAPSLDGEALEAAYQATFGDNSRSADPFDAKYKDLVAKVGEPHATEGDNKFWYAATKNKSWCREVKTIGTAGASLGFGDKAKCGM